MSKLLIIVRGLPGSGKSTLAKSLIQNGGDHFEADMYFMKDDEYCFDPSKLGDAHWWCSSSVEAAMGFGEELIVVSNTFVKQWEKQGYLDLAEQYDYAVQEITVKGDFGTIHGVPTAVIERMRNDWEV